MKILHLIYDDVNNPWVGGGGAVRAYEICSRLANAGDEVTILSGNFPGAESYQVGNLHYEFVGSRRNYVASTFSYACRAAEFVKKEGGRFDIIVEDFAPWNPVFSPLCTPRPVVLHINHREGREILRRWWICGLPFYLLEKWYPQLFNNVTALSEETRRKTGIGDAYILPAGIADSIIRDGELDEREANNKTFLLYVGRLHVRNKGLDVLLSSMKGIDSRLVLAGRGKDEIRLKKMAVRLGLADIEFAGFVTEERKISLLRENCIFVLPSRFEGWGIVVLEAAACGRPVIVSDIPELRYAVDAGFGISFKTGDAQDLMDKILLLLGDEPMRKEMGLKAREYARNFTWDKIADDYGRYLQSVIAASGRRAV